MFFVEWEREEADRKAKADRKAVCQLPGATQLTDGISVSVAGAQRPHIARTPESICFAAWRRQPENKCISGEQTNLESMTFRSQGPWEAMTQGVNSP